MNSYRALDPGKVIDTIAALQCRIVERFKGDDVGLARVCGELLVIAKESSARAQRVSHSNKPLRAAVLVLLAAGAAGLIWIGLQLRAVSATADNVFTLVQGLEAAANLIVLIGAGVFFLTRIEERLKRRDALQALHELRSIVHVIDMHQLTKDPSAGVSVGGKTPSSPKRPLSRFEVARYLDYCSEMLSLTAKVAVLFAQGFPDPVVIEVVSDIERITAGLSQKIWQKIMILEATTPGEHAPAAPAPAPVASAAQQPPVAGAEAKSRA